jgi:FlaG/FlaF family flagellin (archaellin)
MVAITVVLAAILYVMVSNMIPREPIGEIGSLSFQEDENTPGLYIGMFQGSVALDDIEISVYDSSNSDAIILNPDIENYKEIPGGLNITYDDLNENNDLDVSDQLLIHGGESGDTITIADKSSGQAVATHTLN